MRKLVNYELEKPLTQMLKLASKMLTNAALLSADIRPCRPSSRLQIIGINSWCPPSFFSHAGGWRPHKSYLLIPYPLHLILSARTMLERI